MEDTPGRVGSYNFSTMGRVGGGLPKPWWGKEVILLHRPSPEEAKSAHLGNFDQWVATRVLNRVAINHLPTSP
jgi:hypothetical protein